MGRLQRLRLHAEPGPEGLEQRPPVPAGDRGRQPVPAAADARLERLDREHRDASRRRRPKAGDVRRAGRTSAQTFLERAPGRLGDAARRPAEPRRGRGRRPRTTAACCSPARRRRAATASSRCRRHRAGSRRSGSSCCRTRSTRRQARPRRGAARRPSRRGRRSSRPDGKETKLAVLLRRRRPRRSRATPTAPPILGVADGWRTAAADSRQAADGRLAARPAGAARGRRRARRHARRATTSAASASPSRRSASPTRSRLATLRAVGLGRRRRPATQLCTRVPARHRLRRGRAAPGRSDPQGDRSSAATARR